MSTEQPHDALVKAVFGRAAGARALFAHVLPAEVLHQLDLESLRLESSNPIGSRLGQRFCDLLFSVKRCGRDVLVHLLLEHKSTADHNTILDVFTSTAVILDDWRRRHPRSTALPPLIPVVLYHGERPFQAPRTLVELFDPARELSENFRALLPSQPIVFVDLGVVPELERIANADLVAGFAIWLLIHSRRRDFLERLFERGDWLRSILEGAEGEHQATPLLRYVMGMLDSEDDFQRLSDEFADRLGAKGGAVARSLAERLIEDGWKRGLQEGLSEGRQEGRIEMLRESITRILIRRFRSTSERSRLTIDSIESTPRLTELLELAASCDTLESFERSLTNGPPPPQS